LTRLNGSRIREGQAVHAKAVDQLQVCTALIECAVTSASSLYPSR
jgi:hypothetical protein